jgi:hypothetical protein
MARSHWILPRADAACGRAFHPDRPTAETHRVALAFWYRATRGYGADPRLAVYRCKRCFGFHIARKRIGHGPVEPVRFPPLDGRSQDRPEPRWIELDHLQFLRWSRRYPLLLTPRHLVRRLALLVARLEERPCDHPQSPPPISSLVVRGLETGKGHQGVPGTLAMMARRPERLRSDF